MTKRTPASLAEQFPDIALLAKQLTDVRSKLIAAREQEFLLSEQLLRAIPMASGATVSADAFKKEPVSPNAPGLQQPLHNHFLERAECSCGAVDTVAKRHISNCDYSRLLQRWKQAAADGSGATAEAISITATVIHPPGTRGSGATEGNVSQKRASADASPRRCSATFCLKGWRGGQHCTSYCTEDGHPRPKVRAEAAEGATVGRECSTSKAGGTLSDNKPPVVINITPAHLSDDDKITLYQLKARADAAYARDQITHGRDGYNL